MLVSPKLAFLAPSLVNLPNRKYWLVPERRAEAAGKLQLWMNWFSLVLALLLGGVTELTLQANLTRTGLDNQIMMSMLVGFLVITIAMTVGLYRMFRVPTG